MLLQRFLSNDGIEKELALIFVFLRASTVAARLRHVIAPFVIELGELIEFFLKLVVRRGVLRSLAFVVVRFGCEFFEDRIRLHLLLNEIAQLQQRRLKNEQALLELRGQNLLKRKILGLLHSRSGHRRSLSSRPGRGKQFPRRGLRSDSIYSLFCGSGNVTCS